jgi:hypothetical protein
MEIIEAESLKKRLDAGEQINLISNQNKMVKTF